MTGGLQDLMMVKCSFIISVKRFAIDRSSNPFPRQTGPWWFGCPKTRPLLSAETQEVSSELDTEYSEDIDNNYLTVGDEDLDVDTSY